MSVKQRLRRLREKAEDGAVVIHQRDGSLRRFEVGEVFAQLFLAKTDLLTGASTESVVLEAVRGATPESRRMFEERFGPITFTVHIVAPTSRGGWVEAKTLTEDGNVKIARYEGGSEEAERVCEGLKSGTFSATDDG